MDAHVARPVGAALKATLVGGVAGPNSFSAVGPARSTLQGVGQVALQPVDVDATLFQDEAASASPITPNMTAGGGRTTVLPRRKRAEDAAKLVTEQRPRFDRVRTLGEGAMGQVDLARDNDIRRTVAVKRMHGDNATAAALLRFADEVRVVGQLEHPSIVPIYDVGRDEDGQVYLVMKHLEGETMESIIERLRARDSDYVARFSVEHRVHLFLSVLDAIRYAHARGILHRDLKPANIMIGPYGEVTVMDWGIAKPIPRSTAAGPQAEPLQRTLVESHDQRLLETQFGSLAGTPLYMSPEQAAGRNDELDERSDVYALGVMLYEWLVLEHFLADRGTVNEVLAATITQDFKMSRLFERAREVGVAMEYIYVVQGALARDRNERTPSVSEMEEGLKRILGGHIQVRCHVTFAKSAASRFAHWVDHHTGIYSLICLATLVSLVGGLGYGLFRAFSALAH
ncbi:MAG TPA: serine/threonine-protein kinase [Polyangiaceae bacterium]|nr:serine/threonine-protein kinase [Polyangiaceae bacterium]